MKVDITKPIKDFLGRNIKVQEIVDGQVITTKEDLTFRHLIGNVLNAQDPREPDTAETKNKIFQICSKIYKARKEVDLTPSEIALIIERAGKFAPPLLYGRLKEFFGEKEEE